MKICEIADPELRAEFEEIALIPELELEKLGLNGIIRKRLIDGIVLPPRSDAGRECWDWNAAFLQCGQSGRPVVYYRGQVLLVYRIVMALLAREHIREMSPILHVCPGGENCRCSNPKHLLQGGENHAAINARHRSENRTLHGNNNGSRRHPETRPRGVHHPKSQFRDPVDLRLIQLIRATYEAAREKRGVIAFLVRFTGKSRNAVTGIIKRWRYKDIPDDPAAALDPSLVKINRPGDSAKRRTHWPRGNAHAGSRMPVAAKREFALVFHRLAKRSQKRILNRYISERYGITYTSVQSIGYADPTAFGAPAKGEILKLPKIDDLTLERLEASFDAFFPLGPKKARQ